MMNEETDVDKDGGTCANPEDDYPADPDDWTPPEDWTKTPTGEITGEGTVNGKLRMVKYKRRWDLKGDPVRQPDMGPHWADDRFPGKHIFPNR